MFIMATLVAAVGCLAQTNNHQTAKLGDRVVVEGVIRQIVNVTSLRPSTAVTPAATMSPTPITVPDAMSAVLTREEKRQTEFEKELQKLEDRKKELETEAKTSSNPDKVLRKKRNLELEQEGLILRIAQRAAALGALRNVVQQKTSVLQTHDVLVGQLKEEAQKGGIDETSKLAEALKNLEDIDKFVDSKRGEYEKTINAMRPMTDKEKDLASLGP